MKNFVLSIEYIKQKWRFQYTSRPVYIYLVNEISIYHLRPNRKNSRKSITNFSAFFYPLTRLFSKIVLGSPMTLLEGIPIEILIKINIFRCYWTVCAPFPLGHFLKIAKIEKLKLRNFYIESSISVESNNPKKSFVCSNLEEALLKFPLFKFIWR